MDRLLYSILPTIFQYPLFKLFKFFETHLGHISFNSLHRAFLPKKGGFQLFKGFIARGQNISFQRLGKSLLGLEIGSKGFPLWEKNLFELS